MGEKPVWRIPFLRRCVILLESETSNKAAWMLPSEAPVYQGFHLRRGHTVSSFTPRDATSASIYHPVAVSQAWKKKKHTQTLPFIFICCGWGCLLHAYSVISKMALYPHILTPPSADQTSRPWTHFQWSSHDEWANTNEAKLGNNKCECWHSGGLRSGAEESVSEWYLGGWLEARRFALRLSFWWKINLPKHLCTEYFLLFCWALSLKHGLYYERNILNSNNFTKI